MKQYHDHLKAILSEGSLKSPARAGMPSSISLFGYQNRYDLQKGFPILTTKKVNFKHIVTELLWFLKGDTSIKYLVDNGCNIWNEDAYNYYVKRYKECKLPMIDITPFDTFIGKIKQGFLTYEDRISNYTLGDCGKQYGWLWRSLEGIDYNDFVEIDGKKYYATKSEDQLTNSINLLKQNPESRRIVIDAWNAPTLDQMALHPCHAFVQFNCRQIPNQERQILGGKPSGRYNLDNVLKVPKYYLDCQLYQRSADMFLGVPYNISSYALLTHIIAKICNMEVGHFIHTFGDSHIYENHMDQVKELLSRDPEKYDLPFLKISDGDWAGVVERNSWDILLPQDFNLRGYESYPPIKAPLSTGLK